MDHPPGTKVGVFFISPIPGIYARASLFSLNKTLIEMYFVFDTLIYSLIIKSVSIAPNNTPRELYFIRLNSWIRYSDFRA